jgi:glutathione S-transferase
MAMCDKAKQTYIFNKIDPLKGDNRSTRYVSINPTGHIPMIEEGQFKVLGGNHIIFVYLWKSKAVISQLLAPTDNEQKVKGMIGWHQAKMSTPGQQLFRMLYEPTAFSSKPSMAQYNKWRDDMIQSFKALDDKLSSSNFLCGSKMTVGDIVVFNELS